VALRAATAEMQQVRALQGREVELRQRELTLQQLDLQIKYTNDPARKEALIAQLCELTST
jgi:hypothetical protein